MRAIIVEDEEEGMENLVLKLKKHCPDVEIIAKCKTGDEAIRAIKSKAPDLVFLDIHLGPMTGFDVLQRVPQVPFEFIFTTAHDEYAITAIRASAVDYILKPVRPTELKAAVESAAERIQTAAKISRILVPDGSGFQVIQTRDIMYCLADNVNTLIYRKKRKPFLAVKVLKYLHAILPKDNFHRISRSTVVNLDYVESFHRSDSFVTMTNGEQLGVAKDRVKAFLKKLGGRI